MPPQDQSQNEKLAGVKVEMLFVSVSVAAICGLQEMES